MAASIQVESHWRTVLSKYIDAMSKFCLVSAACLAVVTTSGCGLLANAMYIVRGTDAPAEFDEFKDKKIAVVVSTSAGLNADASGILMSRHINELLSRNIKKVDMVNPEEVDRIISDQPIGDRSLPVIGSRLKSV